LGFYILPVVFWLIVNAVFARKWFAWLDDYVLVVRHGIGTNDIFYITVMLSVLGGAAIFYFQRKKQTTVTQSLILSFAIPIISVVVFEYTYDIGKMIWYPISPPFYDDTLPLLIWIVEFATWVLLPLFAYKFRGQHFKLGCLLILLSLVCFLIWFGQGMPLIAARPDYPILTLNIRAKASMVIGYSLLFV